MRNESLLYRALRLLTVAVTATTLAGCAVHGHEYERHDRSPRHAHERDAAVAIPKGHLPPPGECRIWYPDRPPGQQPPPGDCRELRHHVPHGAHLIRG